MTGETVTIYRGAPDKHGNPNKQPVGSATACFAWGPGVTTTRFRRDRELHGESSYGQFEVYVRRGDDVRQRDRIKRENGEVYSILTHAMWDDNDPLSGFDFGWKLYQVEAVSG